MSPNKSSQSILKMLLHRRTLSKSTITAFIMLVMMVVVCQGQTGEILIPLENQTVVLGEEGHFFCQIKGDNPQMRINGVLYSPVIPKRGNDPFDVTFTRHKIRGTDLFTDFNITVTIVASVKYNETVLECQDETSPRSTATLIIKGGPAEPNVRHEVWLEKKEIVLSWPRPFTWEDYSITSYHIVCWVNESGVHDSYINNTENRDFVTKTVKLNEIVPDCSKLQCWITASNALAEGTPAVVNISIPRPIIEKPSITLEKRPLFTEDQKPHVTFCVKLPELCSFQSVNYTITISHEGDQILQQPREFSYRDGYHGTCKMEPVTDVLEDGKEYNVTVFVYGGNMVGNSSSTILTFKPELLGTTQGSDDPMFYETSTGMIVIIGVVSALVILLLVLITLIAISYRKRGSQSNTQPPIKRTIPPMVNNPIYHDSGSPVVYEQVRPLQLERFNSVSSHSNLDCGINRAPSPIHSSGSRTPTAPYHLNNQPRSPGSTGSSTAFIWPYSTIQQTNAATFDAIEASVANETQIGQTNVPLPSSTPGDDNYMTMHSVAKSKNVNIENDLSRPRYVIDRHGNQYIEC